MQQFTTDLIFNHRQAERTYHLRLSAPFLAAAIRPGQFVMLRLPGTTDPLLGRPFAVYDTGEDGEGLDIVYLVQGKLTGLLSQMHGCDHVEVWGPLGNGFQELGEAQSVNLVAGGIGQTPFLAYTRHLLGTRGYAGEAPRRRATRVRLFYGARNGAYLAGVEEFERAGAEVHLATDDGSAGFHGRVTDLIRRERPDGVFVGCGPELMLKSLAALAAEWGRLCHVSLETPMACGFGACYSCVTPVKCDAGWDYRRVCVEGPIFDAATLDWERMAH